jgi:hypothetical protein
MKGFVFFISLLILSCNSQKEQTNNTPNQSTTIEVLNKNSHGGYTKSKTLVIKSQKELQEIYNQINMTRRPGFPIPEIDFDKEMVIALFMGEKTSGGFATTVEKVIENNNTLEIIVKETAPEGIATTMICQPFYYCKVNRSDKEIVFKKVD